MFQQRQPLRQIFVLKMEKLSFEENKQRMTMKIDVLTYMNMLLRQNAKNIVAAFIHLYIPHLYIPHLYSDIGIYIDTYGFT